MVARTGFGRDNISTDYEANPELLGATEALPLGPVRHCPSEE
jgi:hypothetical protein